MSAADRGERFPTQGNPHNGQTETFSATAKPLPETDYGTSQAAFRNRMRFLECPECGYWTNRLHSGQHNFTGQDAAPVSIPSAPAQWR